MKPHEQDPILDWLQRMRKKIGIRSMPLSEQELEIPFAALGGMIAAGGGVPVVEEPSVERGRKALPANPRKVRQMAAYRRNMGLSS